MRHFLINIILLAAAFVLFGFFTRPMFYELQAQKAEKAGLNQILFNSREIQNVRDGLLETFNAISRQDLEKLQKIIPASLGSGQYIAEMESLSKESRLSLDNFSFSEDGLSAKNQPGVFVRSQEKAKFRTIGLNFSLSGSYGDFISFLEKLERNMRLTDVSSLTLREGGKGGYTFSIKAAAYAHMSEAGDDSAAGKDLVGLLNSLKGVAIDEDFFRSPAFRALQDNSRPLQIEGSETGRPNPFLPIGQ